MKNDMKQLIADNLTELIKTKDIDKISVTELTAKSGISRQTFYYHFQDLTDVLEWMIRNTIDGVAEKALSESSLYDAIHAAVKECEEVQPYLNIIMRSQRRSIIEKALADALKETLREGIKKTQLNYDLSEPEKSVIVDFCAYGIIGFILEHRLSTPEDVDQITENVYMLISRSLLGTML